MDGGANTPPSIVLCWLARRAGLERAANSIENGRDLRAKQNERANYDHRDKRDNQRIFDQTLATIAPDHFVHDSPPSSLRSDASRYVFRAHPEKLSHCDVSWFDFHTIFSITLHLALRYTRYSVLFCIYPALTRILRAAGAASY